jgi:hypothetical protein
MTGGVLGLAVGRSAGAAQAIRHLVKKSWFPALHLLLIGCAVVSGCMASYCTGRHGSSLWAYWKVAWADRAFSAGEPGGVPASDEELSALRKEATRWGRWRWASTWAAYLTIGASLLAFLIRPGKLSAASCVICGLMAAVAFESAGVVF